MNHPAAQADLAKRVPKTNAELTEIVRAEARRLDIANADGLGVTGDAGPAANWKVFALSTGVLGLSPQAEQLGATLGASYRLEG